MERLLFAKAAVLGLSERKICFNEQLIKRKGKKHD